MCGGSRQVTKSPRAKCSALSSSRKSAGHGAGSPWTAPPLWTLNVMKGDRMDWVARHGRLTALSGYTAVTMHYMEKRSRYSRSHA